MRACFPPCAIRSADSMQGEGKANLNPPTNTPKRIEMKWIADSRGRPHTMNDLNRHIDHQTVLLPRPMPQNSLVRNSPYYSAPPVCATCCIACATSFVFTVNPEYFECTKFSYAWDPCPFECMTFSYSRWPLRTCFEVLACILFSYRSRRVRNIRKQNAYEIIWIYRMYSWSYQECMRTRVCNAWSLHVALFKTVPILRFASVKWHDRGSKHRNERSNFRLQRPSSHRKNESN